MMDDGSFILMDELNWVGLDLHTWTWGKGVLESIIRIRARAG